MKLLPREGTQGHSVMKYICYLLEGEVVMTLGFVLEGMWHTLDQRCHALFVVGPVRLTDIMCPSKR